MNDNADFLNFNKLWDDKWEELKQWFLEWRSFGIADPTLKSPRALTPKVCNCTKIYSEVTVYMMHNCKSFMIDIFIFINVKN